MMTFFVSDSRIPVKEAALEAIGIWQMSGFGVSLCVKVTHCCSEKRAFLKYDSRIFHILHFI